VNMRRLLTVENPHRAKTFPGLPQLTAIIVVVKSLN